MKRNIIAFLLLLFFVKVVSAQNADINLLRKINANQNKFNIGLANVLSPSVNIIPITLQGGLYIYGTAKKNEALRQTQFLSLSSELLAVGVTYGLKYTVRRHRPYVTYPDIKTTRTHKDPSFPSGHSTLAFAFATNTMLYGQKWYYTVPAYAWAAGVAWSRMHKGVHYPSDVLGGALVGTAVPLAVFFLKNHFITAGRKVHLLN